MRTEVPFDVIGIHLLIAYGTSVDGPALGSFVLVLLMASELEKKCDRERRASVELQSVGRETG